MREALSLFLDILNVASCTASSNETACVEVLLPMLFALIITVVSLGGDAGGKPLLPYKHKLRSALR